MLHLELKLETQQQNFESKRKNSILNTKVWVQTRNLQLNNKILSRMTILWVYKFRISSYSSEFSFWIPDCKIISSTFQA